MFESISFLHFLFSRNLFWSTESSLERCGWREVGGGTKNARRRIKRCLHFPSTFADVSVSFTLKGTNLEIFYPFILRVNEILWCDYLNQTKSWVVLSLGSTKYFAGFWLRPLVSVSSTTAFSIRFIDICVKVCVGKVCVCKKKGEVSGSKENHFYSLPFGQAEASIY